MNSRRREWNTSVDTEDTAAEGADACGHALMSLNTGRSTEFIDITDRVAGLVCESGISLGLVNVQSLHTTTGIVINEHEPLLLKDFEAMLARTAPARFVYRHDDRNLRSVNLVQDERANGHAHCRALFLPSSTSVNVVDGKLLLGRWQRLFFVELDGPRERMVSVMVFGDGARGKRA
jgi:secondary thiamine-phosphate synthase enzyme